MSLATPLLSRIELLDGAIHEIEIGHLKGSLQNPLSAADIQHKFEDCVCLSGIKTIPDALFNQIMSIEACKRVKGLMDQISRLMPE
ncbi:MAG: hypothetical protein HOB38_15455 [Deltaproteobacteria bacterium]|nr:hypothetical protein [Deltaproteobacteria bacterium]